MLKSVHGIGFSGQSYKTSTVVECYKDWPLDFSRQTTLQYFLY